MVMIRTRLVSCKREEPQPLWARRGVHRCGRPAPAVDKSYGFGCLGVSETGQTGASLRAPYGLCTFGQVPVIDGQEVSPRSMDRNVSRVNCSGMDNVVHITTWRGVR